MDGDPCLGEMLDFKGDPILLLSLSVNLVMLSNGLVLSDVFWSTLLFTL
jgi:hypothetical protein